MAAPIGHLPGADTLPADGLQGYFQQITTHLASNPADGEIIITEFNALINKFDPDMKSGKKQPLPLINPEFKPRVKTVREKIWDLIGQKMKIPDLRFEADRLSREAAIPLPNSTRKNNEALMQWFDSNWSQLSSRLKEMRPKDA